MAACFRASTRGWKVGLNVCLVEGQWERMPERRVLLQCLSHGQGRGGLTGGLTPACRSGLGQAVPGIGNASGCTDRTELGALT